MKSKKITGILITIMVVFFIGCSSGSMSKNQTREDHFYINGGVIQKESWDDKLKIERTSWYSEMTLLFDFLRFEVVESSPFYKWFSPTEQNYLKSGSCSRSFVALMYNLDERRLSKTMLKSQLKEEGYELHPVDGFITNFKMHPEYLENSLRLYDAFLVCAPMAAREITISFPGFNTMDIK